MHLDKLNFTDSKLLDTVEEGIFKYYVHKGTVTPFETDIFDKKLFDPSGYFRYILKEPDVKKLTTSVCYRNKLCGYSVFYGNGLTFPI